MSWKKIMKLDVFDEKDPLDWMDDYISDSNPRKDRYKKGSDSNTKKAVEKLKRGDGKDMGLTDIYFLNQHFKGLSPRGGTRHKEHGKILDISQKLEVVMDDLDGYLKEARDFIEALEDETI